MPAKSTRAFRTISEASEELALKPHVLRFWEAKFPDLTPLTRGGGRRFYRPEDINFLRGLRILLHDEKHKIKDVQKLIKIRGVDSVVELGKSSVNSKPSRPIVERDLVPEHIVASVPKPEIDPIAAKAEIYTPEPLKVAQPQPKADVIVPFAPLKIQNAPEQIVTPATDATKPLTRPAADYVTVTPSNATAAPVTAPSHEPEQTGLAPKDTEELESALDRLSALRSRWKKFT